MFVIPEFDSVFVKWPVATGEKEETTLSDVSFTIHSNKLVTVLGKIGSGKVMLFFFQNICLKNYIYFFVYK